jgi:hypothetical protein
MRRRLIRIVGVVSGLTASLAIPFFGLFPLVFWDPPPPAWDQEVRPKDIAGSWYYRGTAPGTVCEITFGTNGTYSLIRRHLSVTSTTTGSWNLSGVDNLILYPSWTRTHEEPVRWWVTSVSSNSVAPFGGDSMDPHRWMVLSRSKVAPAVSVRGLLGTTAALACAICVFVALRWGRRLIKPRTRTKERFSGLSVAPAVLPQILRMRGGDPPQRSVPARHMPGHNRLVATARRLVSQFAFFKKAEDAASETSSHEAEDDSG